MCEYLNEPNSTHTFLFNKILALETELGLLKIELEEAQLRSIEARNPGINIEEVRRSRRS